MNGLSAYFVRHGETDWNLQQRIQGHTDTTLNSNGRAQCEQLALKWKDLTFDHCFSSDLKRAHESAQILLKHQNNGVSINLEPRIREKKFGKLEGEKRNYFLISPQEHHKYGIEEKSSIMARTTSFLKDLSRFRGRVLVMTHGGMLKFLMYHHFSFANKIVGIQNLSWVLISSDSGNWQIKEMEGVRTEEVPKDD